MDCAGGRARASACTRPPRPRMSHRCAPSPAAAGLGEDVIQPRLGHPPREVALAGSAALGPCRPDAALHLAAVRQPVLGVPDVGPDTAAAEYVTADRASTHPRRPPSPHVPTPTRPSRGDSAWDKVGTKLRLQLVWAIQKARKSGPQRVPEEGLEPPTRGL